MNARARRSGMTLLEVIVALTVAGAALAAGAGVLGFLTDQQERPGARAVASASAIREALHDWIAEAHLTTEGDAQFRGVALQHMGESPENSDITFLTAASTPIGTTGTIVRLHISTGDSTGVRGLMAELRPWRRPGPPTVIVLAADATALEARYLGSIHGPHAWQREWISTSVLPSAVELRVHFDAPATTGHSSDAASALLSVPITIPLAERR